LSDSKGRRRPPSAPAPRGTSPVGSPRRKTDGSPFSYGGLRAASSALYEDEGAQFEFLNRSFAAYPRGGKGIGNQFFLRTEPLELPREEDEDELARDGAEREPEEARGDDREIEPEEEPKLLDDEDDLGAEKTDREEDPEKERSRGELLRDGVEPENDLEGRRGEELRLLEFGANRRGWLSP
jgi:hypothetical protein